MSKINELYDILKKMVKGAESGDEELVTELNNSYENLVSMIYHDPRTPLEIEYDNCRQSCVMSVVPTAFGNKDRALVDAKERFSKISNY